MLIIVILNYDLVRVCEIQMQEKLFPFEVLSHALKNQNFTTTLKSELNKSI